jgi:hypothetical protein
MPTNKPNTIDQSVWDALDEVSKMRAANYEKQFEELYEQIVKNSEELDRLLNVELNRQ